MRKSGAAPLMQIAPELNALNVEDAASREKTLAELKSGGWPIKLALIVCLGARERCLSPSIELELYLNGKTRRDGLTTSPRRLEPVLRDGLRGLDIEAISSSLHQAHASRLTILV